MPTDAIGAATVARRTQDRRAVRLGIGVTLTFLVAMLGNWTLAYLAPIFVAPMLQQPTGPTIGGGVKLLLATFLVSVACLGVANLSQIMPGLFFVLLLPALFLTLRLGMRGGPTIIMLVALCGLLLTPMVANLTAEVTRDIARSFVQNIGLSVVVAIAMYALMPPSPSEPAAKPKEVLPVGEANRRAMLLTLVIGSYAVLYFGFMWTNVHTPLYIAVYAYSMNLARGRLTAKAVLGANIAAGVLAMLLYQLTSMAPYLPFVAVMMLLVILVIARMVTSGAPWAPVAALGLSALMILYGESIQPFADSGGSNFADRFGELFVGALWATAALAILETYVFRHRRAGTTAETSVEPAPPEPGAPMPETSRVPDRG